MRDGAEIYDLVKRGMKVANRSDAELRQLLGHLGRKGKITGTAGRIWGEALAEAALRFMKAGKETRAERREPAEGTAALTDFVTTFTNSPDA